MVEVALETELEFKGGPIWTQIEVSTFTGDRETSRPITREDIMRTGDIVWSVIKRFRDPKTGPENRPEFPLNFMGDITERDIFCFLEEEREIVASCFIRHEEDFIGIKNLWEFTQELQDELREKGGAAQLRNLEIVAESWVKQHHPELILRGTEDG